MIGEHNSSVIFSDDTGRRFLLGQLNPREQTAFEENLFTDEQLESRVRFAEVALADDYAHDRFTRNQKQQFRKNFLVTIERKRMLSVSQALHDRLASNSQRVSTARSLKASFDFGQTAWRYAFAALLLLLVFATVWRGVKEPKIVKRIVPERVFTPKPTATPAPQEANHPNTNSSPNHAEEYPAMPLHTPLALTVPVNSNSTAENPAVIVLPKDQGAFVRFEIQLAKDQVAPFRAELWTSKGELIVAADSLSVMSGAKIDLDVPANVFKPGNYQIKLNASGNDKATSYYFRIR